MEITMETNTLAPITELINVTETGASIMATLNDALPFCQKLNTLALKAFKPILDTIEAEGMNAELDKALNDLIVRANSAMEKMEAKRKPGTQLMSKIAKIFTGLENEIEAQKVIAQGHRNGWAKTCAENERIEKAKILKKQNIDREKISLKSEIEKQVREVYQNKLLEFKQFYSGKLNGATLNTIDEVETYLKKINTNYPHDKFILIAVSVKAIYLEPAELAALIYDTRESLYNELSANYNENMESHKQVLIDMIPSKKLELDKIAKAGAELKKQLEEQALARQQQEQLDLQKKADEAKKQDQQNVELTKQIAVSTNLFDTQVELTNVTNVSNGPVRQGYKIIVMSPAGWGAIFLFWFEKEGQKMDATQMGKKTLDQMKSFCEKHAHKTNEKIAHDHIIYEDDFKAVNTKA